MSGRPVLLVTGFGPFPRVRVNPTEDLAARLAASPRLRRLGFEVRAHVFQTRYAAVASDLPSLLADRPTAILHLGVAARSGIVRVEAIGRGRSSILAPDASGAVPVEARSDAARPADLRTSADAPALAARLRGMGVPARVSIDAGRYLCNALYHASLSATRGRGTPVVFVHIPLLRPVPGRVPLSRPRPGSRPRPTRERLARALEGLALQLAVRARSRSVPS